MSKFITLALDAMSGDRGPETFIGGAAQARADGVDARFLFFGDEAVLGPIVAKHPGLQSDVEIRHAPAVVGMEDKPQQAMRRKETSMWQACAAVKSGEACAVVSAGNTGALMAVSKLQLRTIEGVARPAIAALWPTRKGRSVVLDVGANVEADEKQLVDFAIMGEAFHRALSGLMQPSVGLLNVGAEELKGHGTIRAAAQILKTADPELDFKGFIEGDDIGQGTVDVVVTDGFSGNIALKAAEGTARQVGALIKEALFSSWLSRLGALLLAPSLKTLRTKMDPNEANGGVFLGLNGVVIKSHGGSDERGNAKAIEMAANLARSPFMEEIKTTIARVEGARAACASLETQEAAAQ